jgi:uncharacterized protein (TIGR00661 family)
MRILYGVVGEGMGHAIRSRVVLEHLFAQGHEVEIMASSRAADFLAKRFPEVHRIHGLHIIYEENRVRRGRTLWSNVQEGSAALPQQLRAYFALVEDFAPEVVISDFESWVYVYAKLHRLPIVSIDNMQIINRCRHDAEILQGKRAEFELTRAFVKSKLPFCDHYMIATFFYPELRKEKRSSRRSRRAAITCSCTRPPRATSSSPPRSPPPACRAASTGCAAISSRTWSKGTCATGHSTSAASSRTWRAPAP